MTFAFFGGGLGFLETSFIFPRRSLPQINVSVLMWKHWEEAMGEVRLSLTARWNKETHVYPAFLNHNLSS